MSKRTEGTPININNVDRSAIAIGDNAIASNMVSDQNAANELMEAVSLLKDAIRKLDLNDEQIQTIDEDIQTIEVASADGKSDVVENALKNLVGKLKMIGVVVKEIENLSSPISAIARILGLALSFIK